MQWSRRSIALPYRFGFVSLGAYRIDGIVCTDSFNELSVDAALEPPAREMKSARRGAAYIPSCPLNDELPAISWVGGHLRYIAVRYPHHFIRVEQPFEQYLQDHLGARSRATLRRKVRRFRKASGGTVDWRVYRTSDEADAFLRHARAISPRTYQARMLDRSIEVHIEAIRDQASEARLRGYVLFDRGKPVAYLYAFQRRRSPTMVQQWRGYDPAYRAASPGLVLDYFVLESAFRDPGVRFIDLTEGDGYFKRTFATDNVNCGQVYFFAPGAVSATAVLGHVCLRVGYKNARQAAEQLGILTPLRRWLLRGAASWRGRASAFGVAGATG